MLFGSLTQQHATNLKAIQEAKGDRYKKRFDKNLSTKTLYANLRNEGAIKDKNEETSTSPNLDDLNSHYVNVARNVPYSTDPVHMRHPNIPPDYQFNFRCVSQLEVFEAFNRISSNAIGADGFGRKFLKCVVPFIIPVLTDIINCSFISSKYPLPWKLALIRPIPKVNNPQSLTDYRPISILPFLLKVLEILMLQQMLFHFNTFNLFPSHQSGFRKGHSTE
jgi:hypothetical protein